MKQEEEPTKRSQSHGNNIIVLDESSDDDEQQKRIIGANNVKIENNALQKSPSEFFVCEVGMKQNFNKHITNELEKVFKAYEVIKDEKEMKG